jgi:hypothetical protein
MKTILLYLVTLTFSIPSFSQTIWIANNAPGAVGGTNVFTGSTAINQAVAAASNGDIIYVVPSSVVHASVDLAGKGVSLMGGGFNPDKPGALRSTITTLLQGNSNNTRISGLVINSFTVGSGNTATNVMIDKCRIGNISTGTATLGNVIIENCIIGENRPGTQVLNFQTTSTNIRISNNIIYSHNASVGAPGAITSLNAGLVENNIFIGNAAGSALVTFNNVTNSDIRNNIFLGVRPQGANIFTGNTQQNNISFGASDNTFSTVGNSSTSNIQGSDPLLVNLPYGTAHLFTFNAALQAGSPAIGSGFAGINMGIYGGTHPFDNFGTSLPIVQAITPPGTVFQGTNMNVRVQAKGN